MDEVTEEKKRDLIRRVIASFGVGRCALWKGERDRAGFAITTVAGEVVRVKDLAYTLLWAPIPQGLEVAQTCEDRRCVNPFHLTMRRVE